MPKLRLRFRLAYGEPDIGPTGDAQFGEVEDYVLYQPKLEAAKYQHEIVVST